MSRSVRSTWSKRIGISALSLGIMAALASLWRQSYQPIPAEYKIIESVVRRLAEYNDFGKNPIGFTINNGSMALVLAEHRGYCTGEACDFFAQLNPYKSYNTDWDEISRQSYTLGDIGAWSTSSGTIEIPRASFRTYGPRIGWLACTIAHEIAHIQKSHIFQGVYYVNNTIRSKPDSEKGKLSYAKARKQELEADRDSAVMMARAGYKGKVCLDGLIFTHKSSGEAYATEPESTHPGFDERYKAMASFYAKLEKKPPVKASGTPGSFSYSRSDNLLSFIPDRK